MEYMIAAIRFNLLPRRQFTIRNCQWRGCKTPMRYIGCSRMRCEAHILEIFDGGMDFNLDKWPYFDTYEQKFIGKVDGDTISCVASWLGIAKELAILWAEEDTGRRFTYNKETGIIHPQYLS